MKTSYALYALAIVGSTFAQTSSTTAYGTSQAESSTVAGSTTSSSGSAKASGTASAKSSSQTPAAASAAIPTGISSTCQTFLDGLDTDPQLAACTTPLLTATDAFAPTANNASITTQTLTSTLDTLCSSTPCSDTYIRTQLVNFGNACEQELSGSNPNAAVQDTYDILYVMIPLQQALCTKDTDGSYCATKAPSDSTSTSNSSASTPSGLPNVANNYVTGSDAAITSDNVATFLKNGLVTTPTSGLARRAASDDQTVVQYAPNTQVYRDTGVVYLFSVPSLSAASLCTTCTQNILTVYAAWESKTNYGMGLSKSPILGNQAQLWQATSQKCGAAFVSQVQGNVGPVVHGAGGSLLGSQATAAFKLHDGIWTLVLVAFGVVFAL